MDRVGAANWAMFKDVMHDANDTFHQKVIVWKELNSTLNRFGEDNLANGYDNHNILVQLNYNWMRSWPVNFKTETGGLDRQSVQIMINKDYLRDQGYLNSDGLFRYDPDEDLFVIDGQVHVPVGDTPVSQAHEDDILYTIIVKRDEGKSGDKR